MASFLGYGRQSIDEDDIASVVAVLRGDFLTQGPVLERFEAALAEKVGAKFAVAVSSGTAALHLACLAADIGPGKLGVTSAVSFVASANCFVYAGAQADLIDIDPTTLCMDAGALKQFGAGSYDVVVPVLFGGLSADEAEIRRLSAGRIVIEDACHALGGSYEDGRPVGCGAYSDMSVFSFHPVKTITTGEGGAIVTNDPELARRLRLLRTHGIEREEARLQTPPTGGKPPQWYYEQQELGFNYRMTDLQAALGLSQIAKLDQFIARRRQIAAYFDAEFANLESVTPLQAAPGMRSRSGLHLYVVNIDWQTIGLTREEVMRRLAVRGIGSQVHYIPIYRQPFYAHRIAGGANRFPRAESYFGGCLTLPLFPAMTDEDAKRVFDAVRTVIVEMSA